MWQTLAHYLHHAGYAVELVSAVTTRRFRPFFNHDFSKTDPKDAMLVASNARDGYFDYFQDFSAHIRAMHQLSKIALNELTHPQPLHPLQAICVRPAWA